MARRPMSGLTEMMEYFTISEKVGGNLATWPIYLIGKLAWVVAGQGYLNADPAAFASPV
jgi:hypothetical protein